MKEVRLIIAEIFSKRKIEIKMGGKRVRAIGVVLIIAAVFVIFGYGYVAGFFASIFGSSTLFSYLAWFSIPLLVAGLYLTFKD